MNKKPKYRHLSFVFLLMLNAELRAEPLQDAALSMELTAAYSKIDKNGNPVPDLKLIEDSLSKLSDKDLKQMWLNNLLLGYYSKTDEKGESAPDLKNVKRLYGLLEDEELKKLWLNNIKIAELTTSSVSDRKDPEIEELSTMFEGMTSLMNVTNEVLKTENEFQKIENERRANMDAGERIREDTHKEKMEEKTFDALKDLGSFIAKQVEIEQEEKRREKLKDSEK